MNNSMDKNIFGELKTVTEDDFTKNVETNVANNIEKSFTEIHVLIDVLEGEINDENKGQFSCLLKSESLGIQTEKMFNPKNNKFDILKNRISSTITVGKEKKGGRNKQLKTIKHKHNKIKRNRKQKKKTIKRHYSGIR
jgi:hypothetical protein